MSKLQLLFACLFFISETVVAEQQLPVIVLENGGFSKGTLPRTDNWLELSCVKLDCTLNPSKLKISSGKAKNVLDEFEATDVITFTKSDSSSRIIA